LDTRTLHLINIWTISQKIATVTLYPLFDG